MTDLSSQETSAARFCMACGYAFAPDARFCTNCGAVSGSAMAAQAPNALAVCDYCDEDEHRLAPALDVCPACRWLRPLSPGYELPVDTFLWQLDASTMRTLNGIKPLESAAQAVSKRVGRPWLEASVNGVRLSEQQLPDVFNLAVRAARLLGLARLPEIYVSGEQPWDAMTLGSDQSAFVVIGSALLNFREDDLLFVIGREMGHCRAGHALWRTVYELMLGRQSGRHAIAAGGILPFLNPSRIIEAAITAPFTAWARHADITADRAGMLAAGKEDVARRVLLQLTLRSFPLYGRINIEAWKEQEAASAGNAAQLSEWTLTSAPLVAGRLRNLMEFKEQDSFKYWRKRMEESTAVEVSQSPPIALSPDMTRSAASPLPASKQALARITCNSCASRIVFSKPDPAAGSIWVKCPDCQAAMRIDAKPAAVAPPMDLDPATST